MGESDEAQERTARGIIDMTSSVAYQTKIASEKKEEMLKRLHGYWMNDMWDVTDSFFETYGGGDSWSGEKKRIDFTPFSLAIRQELKYFCVIQLINGVLTLKTLVFYSSTFTYLSALLNKYYPEICSFIEIPYEKGLMKYKIFLTNVGCFVQAAIPEKCRKNSRGAQLLFLNVNFSISRR